MKDNLESSYQTDDRDLAHAATILTYLAGNGDWYQQIKWTDHRKINRISPAIRYCTSGGASTNYPGLVLSVHDHYKTLLGEPTCMESTIAQRDAANALILKLLAEGIDNQTRSEAESFVALNK